MELPPDPSTLSRIGDFCMTTVEAIEQRFGPDVLVGAIAIVADIHCESAEGEGINPIVVVCSDPRKWVQLALLEQATTQATVSDEQRQEAVEIDHEAWDED